MDLGPLIQEFIDIFRDYRTTSANFVAATALLTYDIALTLGDEIDLIWRSKWSTINVLHLLVRYYGLGYMIISSYEGINTELTQSFCKRFFPFNIWGAALIAPVADVVLLMRIYALYGQNKKMGCFLVVLWLIKTGTLFALIGAAFQGTAQDPDPLPGILPGCFPHNTFQYFLVLIGGAVFIPLQVLYLGLTLYVLYRRFRTVGLITGMTPLLNTFFRDGAFYCLMILVMYVINLLFIRYKVQSPLAAAGQGWEVAIVAITAGRMVLNLRGSVQRPHDDWTTANSTAVSRTGDTSRTFSTHDIELQTFKPVMNLGRPRSPRGERRVAERNDF